MVDLNITLLIQIVNFTIALIVLNYLLIRPIRAILRQRRELVNGLVSEAGKFNKEAASRIKKYEAELDAARTLAAEQREAIKLQGIESEQSILEGAQNEAQNFLQKSRKEVEQEAAAAMDALRGQVNAMAGKVVARVLE